MRGIIIILHILFTTCAGVDNKEKNINKIMHNKFDIALYNQNTKYDTIEVDELGNKENVSVHKSYFTQKINNTIVHQMGDSTFGYIEKIIPLPPQIFGSYKQYYADGNIKFAINKTFVSTDLEGNENVQGIIPIGGDSARGISFNNNGEVIAIEPSYNVILKKVKVDIEKLITILEKNNIYDRNKIEPNITDVNECYRGGVEINFHCDNEIIDERKINSKYYSFKKNNDEELIFVKSENYWWEVKKKYKAIVNENEGVAYQREVILKIDAVTEKVEVLEDKNKIIK